MIERNERKERIGVVVSAKMDKSVVVKVERQIVHPVYGRTISVNSKFVAHDEKNECKEGDTIKIIETRPISKTKRWRLGEVLKRTK